MYSQQVDRLLEELISGQRKRVLDCARSIIPHATLDDILQPNDFPALEQHAEFRYEEGVLAGMLASQIALRAEQRRMQNGMPV